MPGVVLQPAPFSDTRSAKAAGCPRYFSVILTGTSGTRPTFGVPSEFRVMRRQGGPRNADWQPSDADAIGIYPVPAAGTVVDGGLVTSPPPRGVPRRAHANRPKAPMASGSTIACRSTGRPRSWKRRESCEILPFFRACRGLCSAINAHSRRARFGPWTEGLER